MGAPGAEGTLVALLLDSGYHVVRVTLAGHSGSLERMKTVSASRWLSDAYVQYSKAYCEARTAAVPVDLVGFSLGALVFEALMNTDTETPVQFKKAVLFSPALALKNTVRAAFALTPLLKPTSVIPSKSPAAVPGAKRRFAGCISGAFRFGGTALYRPFCVQQYRNPALHRPGRRINQYERIAETDSGIWIISVEHRRRNKQRGAQCAALPPPDYRRGLRGRRNVAADDRAYGGFLFKPCGRCRASRFLAAGVREIGVSALLFAFAYDSGCMRIGRLIVFGRLASARRYDKKKGTGKACSLLALLKTAVFPFVAFRLKIAPTTVSRGFSCLQKLVSGAYAKSRTK
jgi:pimeloyl-ACP methyl ester carboxylesterase